MDRALTWKIVLALKPKIRTTKSSHASKIRVLLLAVDRLVSLRSFLSVPVTKL